MKTRGHRFFCVCALVSATLFARADQCSDILEHGIFDQYKVTSQKDFQAKVKEFFSKSWEDLKKEHSSSQGGGGLDFFDYFKLTGDGKNDEERFNQLRSQYQSNKDNLFSTSDRFEFESKFVNQSVVDAWKECESGKTVSGWYTAQPDSATVTVHYTLKGPDDPDQVTVSQVIFDDRHLTPLKSSGLQDGSILKKFDYLSQSYRRLDKGAADVTINVVGHGHIALTIQP